ncbi:MAG: hypothetical protein V7637_2760 [Mycobacteriales bacterium]|jgi:uncharacterized protein YndB with AHSA1/START domain
MSQATETPVRQSITVEAPIERAFTVFTEKIDSWWPRDYKIGATDMKAAVLETRQGGRWYEQDEDGSECTWGQVLAWEPPTRVVLSWQISVQWQYEPELAKSTEVEIRFTAESDTRTRVDLEHRGFDRLGAGAEEMYGAVSGEGGWSRMLVGFAAAVTG